MSCKSWKEALVGRLFEELTPEEERRLSDHLDGCEACRVDLDKLSDARRLLREAEPEIPSTPRVVMLTPRPARSWLAFAAGFACAALLLGAGLAGGWYLAAGSLQTDGPGEIALAPGPLTDPRVIEALQEQVDDNQRRIQTLFADRPQSVNSQLPKVRYVTQQELDTGLQDFGREVERRRAQDLGLLLQEIGQTQETLRFVVLANDPRISAQ